MLRALHDWLSDLKRTRAERAIVPRELVHYWINPDAAPARAAWMREQFERTRIPNRRVRARTPDDLPRFALPARHAPTPLQLACLASHFTALEHAVAGGEQVFVVMEDDMSVPFDVDFGRLTATAPAGWEILQLYVVNADRLNAMYARGYRRARLWERWTTRNHSTGAYVCSREGALKVLSRFARDGAIDLTRHRGFPVADEVIYRCARTYTATYPLYVENARFGSTLGSIARLHAATHAAIRDIWSAGDPPPYARRFASAHEHA